jgi:quercetin dioxygenase-like cupin family protein
MSTTPVNSPPEWFPPSKFSPSNQHPFERNLLLFSELSSRPFLLLLCSLCCFIFSAGDLSAQSSGVKVEQLLQTTRSWDGARYKSYPAGQPQITILKITIPRNTALDWHRHPMINAGYLLSGQLVLQKKGTRQRKVIQAGQALAECVGTVHRGYTTDQPAQLIVFYAGVPGMPLSIKLK